MKKDSTNKRLSVLYLPRWYPHRYDPMMGLFIERHGLSVLPHADISVLYVHDDEKLTKRSYEIVTSKEGLFTVRVYFKKSMIKPRFLANLINLYRFFRSHISGFKIIKNEHSSRFITCSRFNSLWYYCIDLQDIYRRSYAITEHWTRYLPNTDSYYGGLRKWLTRIVVKHAGAVMPVTATLRDAMIAKGLKNKNYIVIPNVVDVEKFKPAPKVYDPNKKSLVHLSCFTDKQKNISGILRIMKKLSEKRDDFFLKLIGDGEDFIAMKSMSDELGLTGKFVEFTGLKEGEALVELLNQADLMIMFSNYENLPVVILESYSCGVPVISTRVGGIHEHLNDTLGRLTEPGNEDQFLEAIEEFLDNPKEYQSAKIREYALNNFSNEIIGNSIYNVYIELIAS